MRRTVALLVVLLAAWPAAAQDLVLSGFEPAPEALRESLRAAMYEDVTLLGQAGVWSPRPGDAVRQRLEELAKRRPASAEVQLWLGRALADVGAHREAEEAFRRAETLAPDDLWPLEALAEHAGSRANWTGQIGALKRLAARREKRLAIVGERDVLARELRAIAESIESHQLEEDPLRYRRQAAELFPHRVGAGSEVIRWLIDRRRFDVALAQFEWARRLRPEERSELTRLEVELLYRLDRPSRVREVLRRDLAADDGLEPALGWEEAVRALRARGELEGELRQARTVVRGDAPASVEVAEAVHLLAAAGQADEARDAVRRAAGRVDGASDADLLLLSALQLHVGLHDDAARLLARLGVSSRGPEGDEARVRLALLLAENRGDVRPSGVRALLEPSRLDPGPSVLGGALSLLLGGPPGPEAARELRERDARHVRVAQSAALLDSLVRRSPTWEHLPRVERRLIDAYQAFGAYRTALAVARRFLENHPDHPAYFDVGLEAAALARLSTQPAGPILRQLAQRAVARGDEASHRRVLRALERELTQDGRVTEVLTAYLAAIDAMPDDALLYDALLAFLARHNLHAEEEQVYERAIARFRSGDWASGYARWLLRHRGADAQRRLSRRLVGELGSGELARYLEQAVTSGGGRGTGVDEVDAFFVEAHREALRRHPGELGLVRRLLAHYDSPRVRNTAAARELVVRYAPYDEALRARLYRELAAAGGVEAAIDELAAGGSAAGRALAVDFLVRRAEQRRAREVLEALAATQPGHRDVWLRLAALDAAAGRVDQARLRVDALLGLRPVDGDLLTRAGELAIEEGDLDGARHYWGRIHEAARGDRAVYLRTATLFWDYYLFDDAARTLVAAREAISEPNLYAFQLAAVHESAGSREPAVREYVRVLSDAARSADAWPPAGMRALPPDPERSVADEFGDDAAWAEAEDGAETAPYDGEGEEYAEDDGYDEYDGDDASHGAGDGADDDVIHCASRLVELASRAGDRDIVEAVLRDVLNQSPDDVGLIHVRIDVLERTGRWDEALRLLADAARRVTTPSLRERAIATLTAAGREGEATAILERLAQDRPDDVIPTFRLVDHLERIGHVRTGARSLAALAGRLAADESRRRDRETVEIRLARMLYANGQVDQAIEAGRRAIDVTEGGRRRALRVEVARWQIRAERAGDALETVGAVLSEQPDDPDALDVHAQATLALGRAGGHARQEVAVGLVRAFEGAIAATRRGPRDDAASRERELRRTLVRHLLELGAHRAVLDQHVAMLNASLEDDALLRRAAQHAAEHDLLESLESRYRRDAERSPRDHRLPLVLARLAAARHDFPGAVEQMEACLQIAPERTDLRRELIGYVLRRAAADAAAGGWLEAAAQYRRLAEIEQANGDSGARWVAAEARMCGRAGDTAGADEAVARLLALDNASPAQRLLALEVYTAAGRWREAWEQARAYLASLRAAGDEILTRTGAGGASPQLGPCVDAAVRAGRWREVDAELYDLEVAWGEASRRPSTRDRWGFERLTRLAADARAVALPRALRVSGVDADVLRYSETLRRELSRTRPADPGRAPVTTYLNVAQRAGAAGAPRRQLALLQGVAETLPGPARTALTREVVRWLWRLGADREVADLAAADHALPERERLLERQRAGAALEQRDVEEQALLSLVELERPQRFDARSALLERLLVLRWSAGTAGRESIPLLANPGVDASGQVVNFLLQQGDHEGALLALERYGDGARDVLWLDVARAMVHLHRAHRGPAPDDHEPFLRVLDLRPIGEQVDARPNRRGTLGGAGWVEVARPYGEALARAAAADPDADLETRAATHLEHAGIEAEPRSPHAHVRLAREALGRSDPRVAVAHFRLARQLAPDSSAIRDGLARSLLAAGQRDDAIVLWDAVLEGCTTESCFAGVTRSMVRAGLLDEAAARSTGYLRRRWRGGDLSIALLHQLAHDQGARSREVGGPIDRLVWELWQVDRARDDLLRAAAGLDADRALLEGRARGRYLRQGLRVHGVGTPERSRWIQAYVDYLVAFDEHQALVETLDRYQLEREAAGVRMPVALSLAHARGLLGLGRRDAALEILRRVAEDQPQAAVALLRELEHDRDAWELQLAAARRRIEAGEEGAASTLAAVEALLELGRGDEAVNVARQGALARADDVGAMRSLATLLGEHERPAEALRMRRVLHQIDRGDADNLLAMARLEMALGHLDRASRRALGLLARWAVPAQVEDGAVELLVELSLVDRAQQRRILAALTSALDGRALDEDRALALARIQAESGHRSVARVVLERAVRESAAPWRSLQLLASWDVAAGDLVAAERALEGAVVHADGEIEVRRQLFLVRRRLGRHQAALAAVGVGDDRPAGVGMLRGLDDDEAIALAAEIADSAAQNGWWAAADAYSSEALRRIDEDDDPDRARDERARLHVIRSHIDRRTADARGRPWVRRAR